MSSAQKPVLNTLSSLRSRTIPKTFDFGNMTLNLERAAAKSQRPSERLNRRPNEPSRLSSMLDQLASRPPGQQQRDQQRSRAAAPTPVGADPKPRRRSIVRSSDESSKLNATRARLRLPDPLQSSEGSTKRPAAEYTRPVSSLDRLAAESGIDSSASSIRNRRSYKDRLQSRPEDQRVQMATRFSLPRKSAAGGGGGGQRSKRRPDAPGQTKERKQSRAQEVESARKSAIEARKSAAKAEPIPYSYDAMDISEFSPILQALQATGSKQGYRNFKSRVEDERDAVRLVVGNRSIVEKHTVLNKIETWIPEPNAVAPEVRT